MRNHLKLDWIISNTMQVPLPFSSSAIRVINCYKSSLFDAPELLLADREIERREQPSWPITSVTLFAGSDFTLDKLSNQPIKRSFIRVHPHPFAHPEYNRHGYRPLLPFVFVWSGWWWWSCETDTDGVGDKLGNWDRKAAAAVAVEWMEKLRCTDKTNPIHSFSN